MTAQTYVLQPYGVGLSIHVGTKRPKGLATAQGATRWSPKTGVHVYFSPHASVNTVVHESVHAASFVLHHVGVDDFESDAYLVAYITDLCLDAIPVASAKGEPSDVVHSH